MKNITNTIRAIALDSISKAKQGHSGMVLSAAPILTALFNNHLLVDPSNSSAFDRDRFVLSAGHGSALLYATLHAYGFGITMQDLQEFRSGNEKVSGHPELNSEIGIEMTTGPLGQGIASAVGMAIAEAFLAEQFNKKKLNLIDHHTFCLVGDGCMQEGIESEAASLAGTLKLNKLIVLYDSNGATLDSLTHVSFTEDVARRHLAQGWNVINVSGKDEREISAAIDSAKQENNKPTLIICKTQIGFGSSMVGDFKSHGKVFSADDIDLIRKKLKVISGEFEISEKVKKEIEKSQVKKMKIFAKRNAVLERYKTKYPDDFNELQDWISGKLKRKLTSEDFEIESKDDAGRKSGSLVLNKIAKKLPNFLVGSADLSSSTLCRIDGGGVFSSENRLGRNIFFGIREHAMAAIANGIALHGGLEIACSTFLVFADYLKPALRLSALMNQNVLYFLTHDGISIGSDGPTHQPIEQLAALRSTPNLKVVRPSGSKEISAAFEMHFKSKGPTAIVLSRENQNSVGYSLGVLKGGYVASFENKSKPIDLTVLACGSELNTCCKIKEKIEEKANIRLVSIPCTQVFEAQSEDYQNEVLSTGKKLAIEASSDPVWWKFVKANGEVHQIKSFGFSAPSEKVLEKFGMDEKSIEELILKHANSKKPAIETKIQKQKKVLSESANLPTKIRSSATKSVAKKAKTPAKTKKQIVQPAVIIQIQKPVQIKTLKNSQSKTKPAKTTSSKKPATKKLIVEKKLNTPKPKSDASKVAAKIKKPVSKSKIVIKKLKK